MKEALRPQWGLGLIALSIGDAGDAFATLSAVRTELHDHAMAHDEALVTLDMMDAMLALGMTGEIRALAAELVDRFTNLGIIAGAVAALAYLKESADNGSVTIDTTSYVRGFLTRLEVERNATFTPPAIEI